MWWLLGSLVAHAGDGRGRIHLPPLRVETRASLRDQVVPGVVVGLGTQVARTERWAFDANVAFNAPRLLQVPGPWRTMSSFEATADALHLVNRFVELGPTVGVGYRAFQQQWTRIDDAWVPMVGVRSNVSLLRARKWAVQVTGRFVGEVTVTRMVLETQQVRTLSPFEGQIGARLVFGHGRVPEPRS